MRRKKNAGCAAVDIERLFSDVQSPDEVVRGRAVRELCPCHAGWEMFERHVGLVSRLTRDRSRAVRLHARHVFQDAAEMQMVGDPDLQPPTAEELLRRKRVSRFRPEEVGLKVRRKSKFRRRRVSRIVAW